MKAQTIKNVLVASILPMLVPSARGATTEADLFFNSDADGNFKGWTTTELDGEPGYILPNLDLSKTGNALLNLWTLKTGETPTRNIPTSVFIQTEKTTGWQRLTRDYDGFVVIPSEATSICFALKTYSWNETATISIARPPENTEKISIPDLTATLINGTQEGDRIYPGEGNCVEISLTHPDLPSLTQAYGTFAYYRNGSNRYGATYITAITPAGEKEIKTYAKTAGWTGLLPAETSEIRIKWTFERENSNNYIGYSTVNGKLETDFCVGIFQDGNNGKTEPNQMFSGLLVSSAGLYDIDGDGNKEWFSGGTSPLKKLNYDKFGDHTINFGFPEIKKWVNFGGGNIGGISGVQYGSPDYEYFVNIYKFDGLESSIAHTIKKGNKSISVLDYNNDGKNDFWIMGSENDKDDEFLTMNHDGSFIYEHPVILTPQEYYDYVKEHGGGGLGSGLSVIEGSQGPVPGSFSSYQHIDINNDGLLDFIDGASGVYLMNLGDGRFVKDSFAGQVMFRDFDGDGLNDMFTYDASTKTLSVVFQKKDGESKKIKLFSGFACSDNIWCRDFDRDGDIDILVPFDAKDNNGQSFLLMFENKGNGSFKKHEYFIDGEQQFKLCHDINNDGNYEVLSMTKTDSDYYTLNSYVVTGIEIASIPEVLDAAIPKYNLSSLMIGDWDNSGLQRIPIDHPGEQPRLDKSRMLIPEGEPNRRPDTPASPSASFDSASGDLIVTWNLGNDKETAPLDLTYELRIGTAPDKCDILWTDALPDGRRRTLDQGNCGYSLQRRFHTSSWPSGNIYVSLQVVDASGMGSQFSDYTVIENKQAAADFLIESPKLTAVSEECVVKMKNEVSENVSYTWDFDGAVVSSQTPSEIHLSWLTPGEKTVTLTASLNGVGRTVKKTIKIVPAKLESSSFSNSIYAALDLDMDGVNELLAWGDNFLEGDENGNYTPLKKLFNNNFKLPNSDGIRITDINRDGMPDLYLSDYGSGKRWINHLINEGDKSMELISHDTTDTQLLVADLDNDGIDDSYIGMEGTYRNFSIYRNSGDYLNFIETNSMPEHNTGDGGANFVSFQDYNGDGLIDIITLLGNESHFTVYVNKGNFEFAEPEDLGIGMSVFNTALIDDINGNGKMDIAWTLSGSALGLSSYSENVYIRWNDGQLTEIPAPSGYKFGPVASLFDFDNNGCKDVLVSLDNGEHVIIFIFSDNSYDLVNCGQLENIGAYSKTVSYRRSDGVTGFGKYKIIGTPNTPPTAPKDLTFEQSDEALVISWQPASDAETPAAALRYNISIKHKGAEGEGAYFWSPLNGGLNGVDVPASAHLLNSTVLTIPNGCIAPGEYEVKVQALDNQIWAGDFSETFIMNVKALNLLTMPSETMVGKSTELRMTSGYKASDFDFGKDAVVDNEIGTSVWVRWMSEGEKTITCGDYSKTIMVHPALDASFNLPSEVIKGARVRFECDNLHNSEWSVYAHRDFETFKPLNEWFITFNELDDTHGELIFRQNAGYELEIRHTLTETYGSDVYSSSTRVKTLQQTPVIKIVDIDESTGKHRLQWSMPEELNPIATNINVYKESSRIGEYDIIATLPLGTSSFIDLSSEPKIQASRYCISYGLPYGETALTTAHQPIHLLVNNGGIGVWNLYWGKYEGRQITSYRILRGSTPETLECISEVSGNITSYSDINAPETEGYYAVEILLDDDSSTRAGSVLRSRSNVVSIAEIAGVDSVEDETSGKLKASETSSGDGVEISGIIADEYHPSVIRIYNVAGQLITSHTATAPVSVVPFPAQPGGIYVITAEGRTRQHTRFMKR